MSVVTDRLTKLNVPYEVIPHKQACTSTEEALALARAGLIDDCPIDL